VELRIVIAKRRRKKKGNKQNNLEIAIPPPTLAVAHPKLIH